MQAIDEKLGALPDDARLTGLVNCYESLNEDGKAIATSTWTSNKVRTGASVKPVVKSVKVSKVRVTKKGKKYYTTYTAKVKLKKKLGNGTQGLMTSTGVYARGKGTTFSFTFKNIAGNKKGKTVKLKVCGYSNKSYGGYTNYSKVIKFKVR